MNLSNMTLCLQCAHAFAETLQVETHPDFNHLDLNPQIFNEKMAPIMVRFETLVDVEHVVMIIVEELGYHDNVVTECLVFKLAHHLYHEAFDLPIGEERHTDG